MSIFSRVLLAFYAFCLALISLVVISITVNPAFYGKISDFIYGTVLASNINKFITFLIAAAFLGLSIMFLLSGLKTNKDKKSMSKFTNIGEIKISLNSVESIALAASRKLNGIKETKAYVTKLDDSVSITIKAVILSDINIPAISEDIQVKVKKLVEETTGITVQNVKVLVDNIHTVYKSRVE